jgi:hypothetical protein
MESNVTVGVPAYPSDPMISRYAASGKAFSVRVRTFPPIPSDSPKRAMTASSGASQIATRS